MWFWRYRLWRDLRSRVLVLPVFVLQMIYIFSNEPHSRTWDVLSALMGMSIATFLALELRDWSTKRQSLRANR